MPGRRLLTTLMRSCRTLVLGTLPASLSPFVDPSLKPSDAPHQLSRRLHRIINLELSNKYGPQAWKVHTEDLGKLRESFEERIKACQQDIENLNRKRKADQVKRGHKLMNLEGKWYSRHPPPPHTHTHRRVLTIVHRHRSDAIRKTNELEGVCALLERDVKRLKKKAEKKYVARRRACTHADTCTHTYTHAHARILHR